MTDARFVEREVIGKQHSKVIKITIRVHSPSESDTGDYRCRYEICVDDLCVRTQEIGGVDGMQALTLAIGYVVLEIDRIARESDYQLDERLLGDMRQCAIPLVKVMKRSKAPQRTARRTPKRRKSPK